MDGPIIGETSVVTSDFSDYMDVENFIDMPDENDSKIDTEITDILIEWGMPATMRAIHPIYFAKCLTKVNRQKLLQASATIEIVEQMKTLTRITFINVLAM
jgi:hypothetical protein